MFEEALQDVDLNLTIYGKSLSDYDLPKIQTNAVQRHTIEVDQELAYDKIKCTNETILAVSTMNNDQLQIYHDIINTVTNKSIESRLFFVDAPGGTGKTFVSNAILSRIRSDGKIGLAVASSGIASLLLIGGRTAHSRFKIPIIINENSICNITPNSSIGYLIQRCEIVIWDEAPMMHKYIFHAVDRAFRDITKVDQPFGGKVFVLCGDFRQTLPVIPRGSDEQIVNSSLLKSYLRSSVRIYHLTRNERVLQQANNLEQRNFCEWLLEVGSTEQQELENMDLYYPIIYYPKVQISWDLFKKSSQILEQQQILTHHNT